MMLKTIKKRVEKIEEKLSVKHREPFYILMWLGKGGGLYGHGRINVYGGEIIPCSDEEEMEIMRDHWEREDRRLYGKGPQISFEEYLEAHEYLKGDRDGTRVEDTSRRAC